MNSVAIRPKRFAEHWLDTTASTRKPHSEWLPLSAERNLRGSRRPCDNGGIRERYQHTGRYRNTRRELSYGQGTRGGIQTAPWFGILCHTVRTGRQRPEALPEARRKRSRNLRRLPRLAVTALRRAAPERATTTAIIQIVTTKISPWIAPVILSLNRRPNTGMFSLEEGKIIRNFPDKVPE